MPSEDYIVLSASWLFAAISDNAIEELCKQFTIRAFAPGHTVLRAEDSSQIMYLVIRGKVKAVKTDQNGEETILAFHGQGESFGEIALLDGQPAPAAVITVEHSKLAILNKNRFHAMLSSYPAITTNVINMLCAKLRDSWHNNAILAGNCQGASEKVMKILSQLSQKHGIENKEGILIDIKLTHQSLSDMTGLTRSYVSRILAALQKRDKVGIIHTHQGNRILIKQDQA